MVRSISSGLLALFLIWGGAHSAQAQQAVDAKWIWFDAGDPAKDAPAGKVWFRKEIRAEEPSTGAATVACDDEFTLWVNGRKIGSGGGNKPFRFSLSGIVERGTNVFAVEAVNKEGRAGLLVDAEIRGQSGHKIPCDTNAEWKATTTAPQGEAWLMPRFEEKGWKAVKVIGGHAESPWKEISFATGELDRFQVADGFELKKIAGHDVVGSVIAITWGNRGRLIASQERGPILNVIDTDGDGTFDKATVYSDKVKSCQGLCVVGDNLYAVGDGPQKAGLYLLPDRDHNDEADEVILLVNQDGGIGEHGPHDVVLGPDGWLYHNLGNHAWIKNTPEATTPCRDYEEGYLLEPAFEDANGHAVGIKAPGGTIWRFTPDGKKWYAETVGFRNQYDIAFNQQGDLFTFDSDMEWDVNTPWYRPVRINHCIPGAEFGWRSGAKNWPEWYFDSLPGTIDVGRGSPTGVLFYEHTQFPEKYRGAMLNCDWSMGRIIVGYLKKNGATYSGEFDNLVTGNPLNVSDIEVDRDGSVVFATGGRGTEGGLYRVIHTEGAAKASKTLKAESVADALAMPQPQAAWSREAIAAIKTKAGDQWAKALQERIRDPKGSPADKVRALTLLTQHGPKPEASLLYAAASDAHASVRQFATLLLGDHPTPETATHLTKLLADKDVVVQRRACEAFVRTGLEAPVDPLIKLLASSDRWLRFAARLPLERIPVTKWKSQVLSHTDPNVQLNGLLALYRQKSLTSEEAFPVLKKLFARGDRQSIGLDTRRMLELVLIRDNSADPAVAQSRKEIGETLLKEFSQQTGSKDAAAIGSPLARESGELLAWMNVSGAVAPLLAAINKTADQPTQTHYALCLRYLRDGWTFDDKQKLLDWYESTRDWEGGNSLQGFLRNIVSGCLDRFTPEDRRTFVLAWKERPHATRLILSASQPQQVQGFDQVISTVLAEIEKQPGAGQEMAALTVDVLSRSASPESQALLRKLFDDNADRRDLLARALAKHPIAENVPYLLRGIASGDKTTTQLCVQALLSSDYKASKPEEFRGVILAGFKLGQEGGKAVANLLKKWTGSDVSPDNVPAALAHYQEWFAEKYPDEPRPEPATVDTEKTRYSVQQLLEFFEGNPAAAKGDVARGRQVFAKANCIKCHRFLKEGEGVGPDLTTLRRRFQKKEIVEAVLLPSQVISDQYAAVTVQTVDGLVYTGMPLPNPGSNKLLLLLSDATRLEIAPEKIEEKAKSRVSVMPDGLFKDLTLEEIADLFAFLETSKNNPEPAGAAAATGGK
jgi:putative membrane-bound dehydrogenase-like protein